MVLNVPTLRIFQILIFFYFLFLISIPPTPIKYVMQETKTSVCSRKSLFPPSLHVHLFMKHSHSIKEHVRFFFYCLSTMSAKRLESGFYMYLQCFQHTFFTLSFYEYLCLYIYWTFQFMDDKNNQNSIGFCTVLYFLCSFPLYYL